MTGREVEEELDTLLRRQRTLLRTHLLEPLEPPQELDRLVLKTARLAIQPQTPLATTAPPRRRGWAVPAGAAATVVLSLTVLIDLGVRFLGANTPAQVAQATDRSAQQVKDLSEEDTDTEPDAVDPAYSSNHYPRLAANGPTSAPIAFEVVIRSARLTPIVAPQNSESANR
jgi:hypothetical protein